MAYAYDAIQNMLDANNQKQNIFANDPSQQQNQQQSQSGQPQQQQVKTSTEGQVSSGQSSNGNPNVGQQQSSTDSNATTTNADQAAYQANAGKATQPKVFSDIDSQIKTNQQNLQNEANAYTTAQKSKQQYAIGDSDIDKAVSGDSDTQNSVRSLLGRANINQVDAFTPTTQVANPQVDLTSTDAGLKQLISQGKGGRYTPGMAAFTLQSLKAEPQFQQLLGMIRGDQTSLEKQAGDLTTSAPVDITTYGQSQLTAAQQAAKDALNNRSAAITASENDAAKAANDQLAQYRTKGLGDAATQAYQTALAEAQKNLGATNARAVPLLGHDIANPIDASKYATIHGDYDPTDFISSDQASKFNNILSLLGTGGATQAASLPRGPDYTFDQTGIQNALTNQATTQRAAKDASDQAIISRILKSATDNATAYNKKVAGLNQSDVASQAAQKALTSVDPSLASYYSSSLLDAQPYLQLGAQANANNVLSDAQARTLNTINKDLGVSANPYSKGNIDPNSLYNFDTKRYLDTLTPLLQQQKAAADEAARQQALKNVGLMPSSAQQQGALETLGGQAVQGTGSALEELLRGGLAAGGQVSEQVRTPKRFF